MFMFEYIKEYSNNLYLLLNNIPPSNNKYVCTFNNITLDIDKIQSKYKIILQQHQIEFLQFLNEIFNGILFKKHGVILADDTGLGKTLSTLSSVLLLTDYFKSINKPFTTIYITLKSVKFDVSEEIKKYNLHKHINVILLTDKKSLYTSELGKYNLIITHYDLFRTTEELQVGLIVEFLNKVKNNSSYVLLVLDEAQKIKNSNTQVTRVIKFINQFLPETFTIVSTATPIENHVIELFNLLQVMFINMDIWNDKLIERYVIPVQDGKFIKYKYQNLDELKSILQQTKVYIRRKKTDVTIDKLYLQNIRTFSIDVGVENIQKEMIQILKQETDNISHTLIKNIIRFIYLREILNNPVILKQTIHKSEYLPELSKYVETVDWNNYKSPKDEQILNILQTYSNKKVIVFSFYETIVNHLYELLTKNETFRGKNIFVFSSKRQTNRSQLKNLKQYIILATDVLSTGININLDVLVNYDQLYNPAKMNQRIGRIYRLRHKKVNDGVVINLLSPFDKYILNKILNPKIEIFDLLFGIDKFDEYKIKNIDELMMYEIEKFNKQLFDSLEC
jgi:SNF2 family DNA or RNA helicase